jgi:NADPH:quinone reductase-like Zn-dependent oxidoreductase
VFYGMSDAMPGVARNWLRAGLTWLRTPSLRPLFMIERNTGIFGIHLLHLLDREPILRSALEEIYRHVAAGELKPVIDRTFPLTRDGAVEAHHYLHARKNTGKVVLERSP